MSIGTSPATITVTPTTRKAVASGTNHFRELVSLTVSGFSPSLVGNLVVLLMRGATLVAQCVAFTASGNNATGTIDFNTDEMEAAFEDAPDSETRTFTLLVYDSSTGELIGKGHFDVLNSTHVYGTDTGTVPTAHVEGTGVVGIEEENGIQYFVVKDVNGIVKLRMELP